MNEGSVPSSLGEVRGKLDDVARTYAVRQDFDLHLARATGSIIAARVKGKSVLELGCADGVITEMLVPLAARLEIVEGAAAYARAIRAKVPATVAVHQALFEEFLPEKPFDVVIMASVLHHIVEPAILLRRIRDWLVPGGRLMITVPNMSSMHRRLGVLMGHLPEVDAPTERNRFYGQPGRFTKERLSALALQSGYDVSECFGFFLKPFSHAQMERLDPSPELVGALFELGRQFEDLACQIFLEATPTA